MNIEKAIQISGDAYYDKKTEFMPKLDMIRLKKEAGGFIRVSKNDNGEYLWKPIGDKLKVIFIKIRQKYTDFNGLSTTEFDIPDDIVFVFSQKKLAMASEIKEKNPVKQVQIVYALLPNNNMELVKLEFSGSTLGEEDEKDTRFYSYLANCFDRKKGEHSFLYETIVTAKEKEYEDSFGEIQKTVVGSFERGEKLSDEVLKKHVFPQMEKINEIIENEKRDNIKRWRMEKANIASNTTLDIGTASNVQYAGQDADIDPDKIPF